MEDLDNILEKYKEDCFDFSQPVLKEIYKLSLENPSDAEFGARVRRIVESAEKHHSEKVRRETKKSLQEILNSQSKP
jgi:hypothetical protein